MTEHAELNLDSYYFGFDATGERAVDEILAAVAQAGRGFHHTVDWTDPFYVNGTKSAADLIQDAAKASAVTIASLRSQLEEAQKDAARWQWAKEAKAIIVADGFTPDSMANYALHMRSSSLSTETVNDG